MIHLLKKVFKRKVLVVMGTLVAACFLFALSSCGSSSYDMSAVTFADETVTYDGEAHSIEISGTLPDGVTVSYTGNDQTEVGEYTVVASFAGSNSSYDAIVSMTATLTIKEADMTDVSFSSESYTYDGEYHTLEVSGITDTDRYTVSYSNNSQKAAGEYNALAIVTDTEGTYETEYLTATLTIEEATSADIEFADGYAAYDGDTHSLTATGLPTGVVASYTYDGESVDGETEIGTYTVVASFTDELGNYDLADMTATLYIQDTELSDISFDDETVTYDGSTHSIKISGDLPDNVTVTYSYDGDDSITKETDAGEYEVIASFAVDDDLYEIADMTATLTIEQADMTDIVEYTDAYVAIDSSRATMKYIALSDSYTVDVTYTYPSGSTGETSVGSYDVSATFTDPNGNYADYTATATMYVVSLSSYSEDDAYTFEPNGDGVTASITGCTNSKLTYTSDSTYEDIVVIPTYCIINDVALIITSLPASMFLNNTTVQEVTMSNYVTTLGASAFNGCTSLESVTISSSLAYIDNYLFYGDTSLTNIENLDTGSLTSIGIYAFSGTALTSLDLSDNTILTSFSTGSFANMTSLKTFTLPKTLTSISEYCFNSDTALTSISIPAAVTSIGEYSFNGCTSLATLTFSSSSVLTTIGVAAFQNTIVKTFTAPSTLTTIGGSAFNADSSMTSLTFDDALTTIGAGAFMDCTALDVDLIIPANVTSVGNSAFARATITSLEFEGNGTSVATYGFYSCTKLTTVTTDDSESTNEITFGDSVFQACTTLSVVVLSDNITEFGTSDFTGLTSLDLITTTGNYSSTTATDEQDNYMPEDLEVVKINAFSGCTGLTGGLYFYDNLEEIMYGAFSGCTGITSVAFGGGEYTSVNTASLDILCFSGCTSIATVSLYGVEHVGQGVFNGCTSITTLNYNTALVYIGVNVFTSSTELSSITYYLNNGGTTSPTWTVCTNESSISISELTATLLTTSNTSFSR